MGTGNINFDIWVTQKSLSKELKVSVQCVQNWVKRGNIKSQFFPQINKTLVNKKTLNVREYSKSD